MHRTRNKPIRFVADDVMDTHPGPGWKSTLWSSLVHTGCVGGDLSSQGRDGCQLRGCGVHEGLYRSASSGGTCEGMRVWRCEGCVSVMV